LAEGSDELNVTRDIFFLSAPIQLRGQPSNKKKSSRSEAWSETDSQFVDFGKMVMRRRMIEELCKREANFIESCPIQVAKHDALLCLCLCGFHETHLSLKILPSLAIVNDPIDPRPELWIHRVTEFLLPPKVQRQI
jgi:hypothetical protein